MRTPDPNPLVTRADLQDAFRALESPLLAIWAPDAAGPDVVHYRATYAAAVNRLEGVARYLWALAPYTAGGGESPRGWPLVLDAIAHGIDPGHPQYWGECGNNVDQRAVEMAAFGVALRLVPEKIWAPLPTATKDRLAAWLGNMVDKDLAANNWQFFRLLVTMGLRHIDRAPKVADEMDDKALALIESYYLGDGWYTDGRSEQRDYYIATAFHFYGQLLARFATSGPVAARAAEFKDRARQFGESFVHWFAADGAGLAFGRSLTYRFAQAAYWGGAAVAGVHGDFTPGQLKGMLLRNLRWWWKQPFLTDHGLLSLGYAYPNLNMLERYNAQGSPYWAFKSFAVLQLPEDHPFWSQPEEPLPKRPSPSPQPHPRFLLTRDDSTGDVTALNAGQWYKTPSMRHRDAKYAKLAYSTFFGPTVGPNHDYVDGVGIDGTLAVFQGEEITETGTPWQARGLTTHHQVAADHAVSDWASIPGVSIRSWLIPAGPAWHVRVHRVETDHVIHVAEGGFAASDPTLLARTDAAVRVRGQGGGESGLVDVTRGRQPVFNDIEPNSSLFFSRVKAPVLLGRFAPGVHWTATAVFGAAPTSSGTWDHPPEVRLDAGHSVTVTSADGKRTIDLAVPITPK